MIPRVLKNFGVFVNGLGYMGRCTEAELPDLKIKTEEVRAGGMDGSVEVDMGMETLSAKLTFAEYIPEIMKLWGKADGNATRLQLRGAIQRDGEAAVSVVAELHGGLKGSTMGSWKAGDLANHESEMTVRYYKLTIGDDLIYEIDVEGMVRNIGGTDELASIRAAIGM